jgi:hypothetical protein
MNAMTGLETYQQYVYIERFLGISKVEPRLLVVFTTKEFLFLIFGRLIMSIKIDGIKKLRANHYDKIVINQDQAYGDYSVNIKGKKIEYATERVGDRFSKEFKNKSEIEQIKAMIEDYINNTKINGITDLINLPGYGEQRFNVVYGNFGHREMILRLFNKEFSDVFKKIQQKFYQDRFDFCYDEKGIKTFKISTCSTGTAYTIDTDKLHKGDSTEETFKHIILQNKEFRLTEKERIFISDFVINIFSKFGEEIKIEKTYDDELPWRRKDPIGYIFKCGDVKIYIDNFYPLLYILVIIGNYNLTLKYEKEKCMKRQLRMEEF